MNRLGIIYRVRTPPRDTSILSCNTLVHEDGALHLLLSVLPNPGYSQVAGVARLLKVQLLYPVSIVTLDVLYYWDDKRPNLHSRTKINPVQQPILRLTSPS